GHLDVRLPEGGEPPLHVLGYGAGGRAAHGGEGHPHGDRRLVDVDAVDEAELVDVEGDLRVVALADGPHDLRLGDGTAAIADGRADRSRGCLGDRLLAHARSGPGVHAADEVQAARAPGQNAGPTASRT